MKTILVPIDYSDITEQVIHTASALAGAFGSRVILVHVTEPQPQFVGFDPGPLSAEVVVPVTPPVDVRRLDGYTGKLAGAEVIPVEVQGSAPEEILKLAREQGAEVIVMGSHGHGALYHLLAGSVTNAVLKGAACPVLVVPSGRKASA